MAVRLSGVFGGRAARRPGRGSVSRSGPANVFGIAGRGLRNVLILAAAHLGLALATAFVARGWDLDRLRSRSRLTEAAGVAHDALVYPHDALLRAIPNAWLIRSPEIIPLAIVANSLLWGGVLLVLWRAWEARQQRGIRGGRRVE
jgi:hypothetical protein